MLQQALCVSLRPYALLLSKRYAFTDIDQLSKLPSLDISELGSAQTSNNGDSLLTMPFDKLSKYLGGSGRAKLFWDILKRGKDPLSTDTDEIMSKE